MPFFGVILYFCGICLCFDSLSTSSSTLVSNRNETRLLALIWESEEVPSEWCSALIIPVYKKSKRTSCENHSGISLVNVASKLRTGIILRRLTNVREKQIRENQAGFRPDRGCIDRIFSLHQILEPRHMFRLPTTLVFLDLKVAFDSVDRNTL